MWSRQFEVLLKTKKSADRFLTDGEKSLFMAKASIALLEQAKGDTRAGQREKERAKKAAAAAEAAASAEEVEEEVVEDGEGEEEAAISLPDLAGGKFLQIDLDSKAAALSSHLRKRKAAHRVKLADYRDECARMEAVIRKQREMEAARAAIFGDGAAGGAGGGSGDDGSGGHSSAITDLSSQVGDFAAMMMPKPPPPLKLLLAQDEIRPLIAEALLGTADKINAGTPIDANRSIQAAARGHA